MAVRIRPSGSDDQEEPQQWSTSSINTLTVADKEYNFDCIFSPYENNGAVFREIEPLLQGAVDGHSALIFGTASQLSLQCHYESTNTRCAAR